MSEFKDWLLKTLPIQAGERLAVALAFGWFFFMMLSYQVLRPIRESLVGELDDSEKKWLFLGTLLAMIAAVPIYSKLVSVVSRRRLVLLIINFFGLCILGFACWNHYASSKLMIRVFFIWVSVFSLYSTSVIWSVLTDQFSNEQGKRLFGPIAAGATIGAITGSGLTMVAKGLGITNMLLFSAVTLETCLLFAIGLEFAVKHWPSTPKQERLEGGILDGLIEIARSPYLLRIILLLSFISLFGTTIYVEITSAAKLEIADRALRTGYFAKLNLFTQMGTLCIQIAVVGPLMRKIGLAYTLMILPVVAGSSFLMIAANHSLLLLSWIDVISRITTYGIAVPSREVLFTVVSREAKYKAKNVIDTIVIRGADSAASSLYDLLKGLASVSSIALAMFPLTIVWLIAAYRLGKQQQILSQSARSS